MYTLVNTSFPMHNVRASIEKLNVFCIQDQNCNEQVITEGACDRLVQQDTEKHAQDLSREAQTEAVTGDSAEIGVNLCGAVELAEVRSLIKEWICSTPGLPFVFYLNVQCHKKTCLWSFQPGPT